MKVETLSEYITHFWSIRSSNVTNKVLNYYFDSLRLPRQSGRMFVELVENSNYYYSILIHTEQVEELEI